MIYAAFTNSKQLLVEDMVQCKMQDILSFLLHYRRNGKTFWCAGSCFNLSQGLLGFFALCPLCLHPQVNRTSSHMGIKTSLSDGARIQSPWNPQMNPGHMDQVLNVNVERLNSVSFQVLSSLSLNEYRVYGDSSRDFLWAIKLNWKKNWEFPNFLQETLNAVEGSEMMIGP